MQNDSRHVRFLLIALAAVMSPLSARAQDSTSPIILAQDTAPADAEEKKDEKKQKGQDREQRRQEKQQQRQERREETQQERQNQNQQRNEQQREKQQERAQQRQQEMERRQEERQQQQKLRQEQNENQRQEREAERARKQQENERPQQERVREDQQRDQKRQEQEAERAKKQQDNERQQQEREAERTKRQQERVREDQQRDQKRQEQEAEGAKKQQDNERQQQEREAERTKRQQERVREDQQRDQQRQEQEAERARKQQDNERQQQERVREDQLRDQQREEQKARDDRTAPDGARPARDDDRRGADPNAERASDRDRRRDRDAMSPRERRRVRSEEIRESYRQAPRQQRSFDELKRNRRERSIADGKLRVIEEPDRRVIVKQDNRTFIRHDESERFRRIAPDARTIRRADGTSTTFMTRRGGIRIYDVTDRNGRLLQRYRRYPDGREVMLIDNRRYYQRDRNRSRDVLIGAGIGLVIGSAIALSAPEVRIPRDEYIVDYGRASDDDLYEALTAPPIERLERGYSLEEIRYSRHLRDRMRRIDLDTVTFDFGSWEVGPDQGRALDRLAEGINRVLARNPDEIFMIEGHTDAVGSEEDNLTLSDRRAQSVAEILTTDYGVAPENLVTQGYGEEQLKVPTDGPERANRRITVRRIGPLLSGRADDDRYSGGSRDNDRTYDEDPGFDDGRYEDRR